MLDLKKLQNNLQETINSLGTRGGNFGYLNKIITLDEERKETIIKVENLRLKRNKTSKLISSYKREEKEIEKLIEEMNGIRDKIQILDEKVKVINGKIEEILLSTPNIPNATVPIGKGEKDNVEIRRYREIKPFDFVPQTHWDLMTNLKILDFDRANKMTGRRFAVYKGIGASLERALINFMLDLHTREHGYIEVLTPLLVNRQSLIGTGQLPKFEEDLFKLEKLDYFLIPTAEVPITNLHYNETLNEEELPLNYTAVSACFRSEVGAAGRDTRGLIRQHQFNKVELVKMVKPEESYKELEALVKTVERVMQLLELPYRVIELCTGDIGFSAAKTYDIEVWLPSYNDYKEISSCSNFEDYQARRSNIRFRRNNRKKIEFVHTINGSGLAIGRTVAALIENYQRVDGTVVIPKVLRPYMGGIEVIS